MNKSHLYKPAKYLAAGAFMLFGRYVITRLLSGQRGKELYWKPTPKQQYFTCPSGNVWYAEFDGPADAPPLVFIHGINANHVQWYYQRTHFNKSHRLIFLDLPLQGNNSKHYQLDLPTLAADLQDLFTRLNLSNAVVYGHSMGGMVLLQYAALHLNTKQVKAMVVHGASYTNPISTAQFSGWLRPLQEPLVVPLLGVYKKCSKLFNVLSYINFLNGVSALVYRFILFSGKQTANQLLYTTAMAPTNDAGAVAESLLQLMQYDVSEHLSKIDVPVLLISGLHDRFNTVECNLYMHRYLPNAQITVLAAGHQAMVEDHEHLNAALNRFMQEV
jgi:pimeloyl-ACP methyl ester carboxylesterase